MRAAERTGRIACGVNSQFEEHLARLLVCVEHGDDLFGPDCDLDEEAPPATEGPGMVRDRYRLLARLGEGAIGTVFEAEQTQPFRRRVALKVIKPGALSHGLPRA